MESHRFGLYVLAVALHHQLQRVGIGAGVGGDPDAGIEFDQARRATAQQRPYPQARGDGVVHPLQGVGGEPGHGPDHPRRQAPLFQGQARHAVGGEADRHRERRVGIVVCYPHGAHVPDPGGRIERVGHVGRPRLIRGEGQARRQADFDLYIEQSMIRATGKYARDSISVNVISGFHRKRRRSPWLRGPVGYAGELKADVPVRVTDDPITTVF